MRAKCIDDSDFTSWLIDGAIYDVMDDQDEGDCFGVYTTKGILVAKKRRFRLLDDEAPITLPSIKIENIDTSSIDPEEERLRDILTQPSADSFTCQKCGAPKSVCKYH